MAVLGLNHVNIRTLDIAGTATFYARLLGLRYEGPRQVDGFERNWLLDGEGRPIIHLRALAPDSDGTGAVDHIALSCDDKAGTLERLKADCVGFALRDNAADGITQLFLKDPNGVALELSFPLHVG